MNTPNVKPEETRNAAEVAKLEDLEQPATELSTQQAGEVHGGRKAGGDQQDYLVVTMSDVLISS